MQQGDGVAASAQDVEVYVVRADGALVEASGYALPEFMPDGQRRWNVGALPAEVLDEGTVWPGVVEKSLRARTAPRRLEVAGARWAAPRVAMTDLLLMYDWNVWHRRSVILKALLVGGLGWRMMEKGEVLYDPREHEDVPDRPAARLLSRPNANRLEGFDELVYRFLVDFEATGNAYFEVVRDGRGRVAELYHAPARTMRRDARFDGYWQVKKMQRVQFAAFGAPVAGRNEILHSYVYDPMGDYYGMPEWMAALVEMGLGRTIMEFNLNLFKNSLMAHVAVVVEGGRLSDAGRKAVKDFIKDQALGVKNAGRILLLETEGDRVQVRIEKLNLDVQRLIETESLKFFRDSVLSAHAVPPRLVGVISAGQLGSGREIEGQLRILRETVLRPKRRRLERVVNEVLKNVEPGVVIQFNQMDITDIRSDAEFFQRMLREGVYAPEEVRALLEAVVE